MESKQNKPAWSNVAEVERIYRSHVKASEYNTPLKSDHGLS